MGKLTPEQLWKIIGMDEGFIPATFEEMIAAYNNGGIEENAQRLRRFYHENVDSLRYGPITVTENSWRRVQDGDPNKALQFYAAPGVKGIADEFFECTGYIECLLNKETLGEFLDPARSEFSYRDMEAHHIIYGILPDKVEAAIARIAEILESAGFEYDEALTDEDQESDAKPFVGNASPEKIWKIISMDHEEFENSSIEEYLEEEPGSRADFEELVGFYYDIEVEEEYGSISFIAGPCIGHGETTSDAFTCYAYLEQFLNEDALAPFIQKKHSDAKSVWIGASENYHTINDIIPGKFGELEAKLIEILETAGFERNSELGDDMRAK